MKQATWMGCWIKTAGVAIGVFGALQLFGSMIVDTGPGQGNVAILLGGGSVDVKLAGRFDLNEDTTINAVRGWITTSTVYPTDQGVGGQLDISICTDLANNPGTTVYSGSTNLAGQLPWDWYGLSNLAWTLDAGRYWVVFGSPDGNPYEGYPQFGYMQYAPPHPLAAYRASDDISNYQWVDWIPGGVGVQIEGQTAEVPDASTTLSLLAVSLGILITVRRYVGH